MNFKQLITTFITALLSSTTVMANTSENGNTYGVDILTKNDASREYNVVDNIDLHTGQINFEQIDISLPGNGGLSLNIGRSYQKETLKNYGVPHLMGNWALEIPKVEMNSGDLTTIQSGCSKPDPGVIATTKLSEFNGFNTLRGDKNVKYRGINVCTDQFDRFSPWHPTINVRKETKGELRWMQRIQSPYQSSTRYSMYQACHNDALLFVVGASGSIVEPEYIDRPWLGVNVSIPGQPSFSLKHVDSSKAAIYEQDTWVADNNTRAGCISPKSGTGITANNVMQGIGIETAVNPYEKAGFNVKTPSGIRYQFDVGPSIVETNQIDYGSYPRIDPSDPKRPTVLFRHNNKKWSNSTVSSFENKINKLQYLPSLIEDNNGNWIKFEYKNVLPANTSSFYGHFVPEKITTSDGRAISIEYYSSEKIWSSKHAVPLIRFIKSGGRTWEYLYNAKKELEKVILPEPQMSWTYVYDNVAPQQELVAISNTAYSSNELLFSPVKPSLKKITTPTGVNFEYTYKRWGMNSLGGDMSIFQEFDEAGDQTASSHLTSIASRKISGAGVTADTKQFSYTPKSRLDGGAQNTNKTTVTHGSKKTEYYFDRYTYWGLLRSMRTYDLNNGGALIERQDYEWKAFNKRSHYGFYKVDPIAESKSSKLRLRESTVRLERLSVLRGNNTSKYVTEYSDFDDYLFPKSTTEYFQKETGASYATLRTRKTATKYIHNKTEWLLGLVDTSTTNGIESINNDYDALGHLQKQTTFGHSPITYDYHPTGDLRTITDASGYTTTLENYKRGIPQKRTHNYNAPIAGVTKTLTDTQVVDYFGNTTSATNRRGHITKYTYDKLDRLTGVDFPINLDTAIRWDTPRKSIETRGALTIEKNYDGLGRTLNEISNSKRTDYQYDSEGRLIYQSNVCLNNGNVCPRNGLTLAYDALGRVVLKSHTSDGSKTSIEYIDDENKVITTTPSVITEQLYRNYGTPDEGELIGISVPAEDVFITIARDVFGKINTITNGSVTRTFRYNTKQQLQWIEEPERLKTGLLYNDRGLLQSKTINGKTISYYYDSLGQQEKVDPAGTANDTTMTYNENGSLIKQEKGTATWTYDYDHNGNTKFAQQTINDGSVSINVRYDYTVNNLDATSSVRYPSGKVLVLNPDVYGRPTQLDEYLTGVTYHPNDSIDQVTYKNGLTQRFTLDNKNRLNVLSIKKGSFELLSHDYDYTLSDNLDRIVDKKSATSSMNRQFSYDNLDRLTTVTTLTDNKIRETFNYNELGNVTYKKLDKTFFNTGNKSVTPERYEYGSLSNRLDYIKHDSNNSLLFTYTYDGSGNLSMKNDHLAGKITNFTYDPFENLTSVTGSVSAQFAYDGNHRLTMSNLDGVKTYSSYQGEDKLIDYNLGAETLLERYYLGGKAFVERVVSNVPYTALDTVKAAATTSGTAISALKTTNVSAGTNSGTETSLGVGINLNAGASLDAETNSDGSDDSANAYGTGLSSSQLSGVLTIITDMILDDKKANGANAQ